MSIFSLQKQWYKIAESEAELRFNEHNLMPFTCQNKSLVLAKHNDTLFACAAKCPHAASPMVNGYIDAKGCIVCPLHRYKFNLNNGLNVSGEGYYLKTYPVKIDEQGVWICM